MLRQNRTASPHTRSSRAAGRRVSALAVLLVMLFSLLANAAPLLDLAAMPVPRAEAAGILQVKILAGYNLVVDSNASSPSTYAPSAATVAGRFCNTGDAPLTNVMGYIGNYAAGTPGVYPTFDSSSLPVGHPLRNTGLYAFIHIGGSLGAADAARYVGTLAPGECKVQYWHFKYPQCRNVQVDSNWVWQSPPCSSPSIPIWGDSVKTDDDISLNLNIWATSAEGINGNTTHPMTMRNEISAMANKIEPNPDGEWFNTKDTIIAPGELITSNGILYEIGVINQGFDNDGNGVPDYNAWLQPIGDASYDPGCFRLVRANGVFTITRSGGNPDMIIPFSDAYASDPTYVGGFYLTNLPPNNTGTRGLIYYTFMALGGPCSTALSPYQEVASGHDNEKFNGDYGTAIPPIQSTAPRVTLDKTNNPSVVSLPGTTVYQIAFANTGTKPAGLGLGSGFAPIPLVISDTVPNGTEYVGGSAGYNLNYTPNTGITYRWSNNSGATWSVSSSPPAATMLSTWPAGKVILQWWLNDPLPAGSSGNYGQFTARVPAGYSGPPVIENCASSAFDTGLPFARDCSTLLVQGNNSIGDFVWRDLDGDGIQDGGSETGIANIDVYLYYDADGDGLLDATDPFVLTTQTNSSGIYSFPNLPDGRYLVRVASTDTDLPTGYTLTTPGVVAVALDPARTNPSPVNDVSADFGFGPTLKVDKHLNSASPAYVGEEVTFHIDLYNTLPGDGTANGFCQYVIYPTIVYVDDTQSPPGGAGLLKQWATTNNLLGLPDSTFATTDMADANERVGLSGFNKVGAGNITKVETVVYFREVQNFVTNSRLFVRVWDDTLGGAIGTYTYNDTYFSGGGGSDYTIRENVTALRAGGWTWSHFLNNTTEMQLEADKGSGNDGGEAAVDAVAYIVTTDRQCGGADTTIAVLPLDDTYDADLLQFLYAEPPVSSATTSGTAPNTVGTLSWDNLGPLYAGGVRSVAVTFRALATVAAPGTTDTASVTEAKFASGRDVNDDDDDAQVPIAASGSIAGTVWADGGTTAGWVNPNGYDGTDTFIPNVKVELYGCYSLFTGQLLTSAGATTGKDCTDSANKGEWRLIATDYTDASGNYSFPGLRDGYYNVEINDGSPPAGFPTRRAEADPAGNGSGATCGTCDGLWNTWTANLSTFNYLDNSTGGENINRVNFGYINASLGAVAGYIWHDVDADGVWDPGEQPIAGVSVSLVCTGSGCPGSIPPVTTDANGYYQFTGLPVNNATYQVVVTPPSGMSQSGDPDVPGAPCGGSCDNQKSTFSLTAGQVRGPYNFGYTGGLDIGDTVYADWNGDGEQDSGEEGIADVVVYLYRDVDGDGVVDPGTDLLLGSDTTDATGFYQFTNLPGNGTDYIVVVGTSTLPAGYTQTGDPDETGSACTTCDSQDPLTLDTSDYPYADFGYRPRGSSTIGDYVWLDVDGDGVQDGSESGINGVTVNLYQDQDCDGVLDAEDALVATTATGFSVYDGYIDIDRDGSYNETGDDSPALLGVRVIDGKLDLNGDGVVNTLDDGTFAGYPVYDGLIDVNRSGGVTTGDDGTLNGLYQFRDLPAGNYIVDIPSSNFGSGQPLNGLTQSYDPDSTTVLNNQDAIALGSAENYVLGDFGYTSSAVGDTIWLDNNGNGLQDAGEPGIGSVAVSLYTWTDTDGDGRYDAGEPVSGTPYASTTTDANGIYRFTGLPAGNYMVSVSPPGGYTATGDPDYCLPAESPIYCFGYDNKSYVTLPLGQVDWGQDFGYQAPGVLGDYVWLDSNADGIQDVSEAGIANVTVRLYQDNDGDGLYDAGEPLLRTLETDSNGYYTFGQLADGNYVVVVDSADPELAGLSQTYDRNGPLDHQAGATLSAGAGRIHLDRDFGYRFTPGINSLSGTAFYDTDNDAALDGGETGRYANVTIYLWRDGILVGTTTTDANGNYSFTQLPDGTYTVSVDSNDPDLGDAVPTSTSNPTISHTDTLSGGENSTGNDFGFLFSYDFGDLPAAYNNTLLGVDGARHFVPYLTSQRVILGDDIDTEPNGQPSANADGDGTDEDGVTRVDEMSWAPGLGGGSIEVTVSGCPSVCYLSGWIDWTRDSNFADPGERILAARTVRNGTQIISFDIPADTSFNNVSYYARFRLYTTNSPISFSSTGAANNGEVEDYLWGWGPTAVKLLSFSATARANRIAVAWETASEDDNAGFNLYRRELGADAYTQLNSALIPSKAPGQGQGASYTWVDGSVTPGVTYEYLLEDVDLGGARTQHGPAAATARFAAFYPLIVK